MDASKVSFFSGTKEALNNPGLDFHKKRALKIERVKAYIRLKPAGHKFRMAELIAAAGYNPDDGNTYSAGYGFLKGIDGKEISIEKTPTYRKQVNILGDDTVKTTKPAETETPEVKTVQAPAKPESHISFSGEVNVILVREVERLAKQFAWKNDSNDLREFVRSLK